MAKQPSSPSKLKFAFQKKNYQLLLIGIGIVLLGYLLMTGGGSEDPNAPIVVLFGYGFIGYAIMHKPKQRSES